MYIHGDLGLARPVLISLGKIRRDHRLDKLAYYFSSDIKQMLKLNSSTNFGVPLATWLKDKDGFGGLARDVINSSDADAFLN